MRWGVSFRGWVSCFDLVVPFGAVGLTAFRQDCVVQKSKVLGSTWRITGLSK